MRRPGWATPCMGMNGLGAVVASIGVILGVMAVRFAQKRNQAQPVESDVAAENKVLEFLEKDPAQYARAMGEMREVDYTNPSRRARYAAVVSLYMRSTEEAGLERIKDASSRQDEEALQREMQHVRARAGGVELAADEVREYLRLGETVLSMAAGREQNTERSRIEETGDDRRPHRRIESEVRLGRLVLGGIFGGIGSLLGYAVASATFDGPARWAAIVAMILVSTGGIAIGAVDLDTFYLDTLMFWVWAGSSWTAIVVAAWIEGRYDGVVIGLGSALGVAASFEIVARVWGKLSGMTQGAGDTWIVLCTAGVPSAVAGEWRIAVWSILAGAIGAAGHWGAIAIKRGASRNTPVPFGPWLIAGAWVAMGTWLVIA